MFVSIKKPLPDGKCENLSSDMFTENATLDQMKTMLEKLEGKMRQWDSKELENWNLLRDVCQSLKDKVSHHFC